MKIVVRSLGVVYACRGCPAHGNTAREVAALLEARGLCETGTHIAKARERYPVVAIDGCADGCVQRWLAENNVEPHRHYVEIGRASCRERV